MNILDCALEDISIDNVLHEQINNIVQQKSSFTPIERMHSIASCIGYNLMILFSNSDTRNDLCKRYDDINKASKVKNMNSEYDIINDCFMWILKYEELKKIFENIPARTILFENYGSVKYAMKK